MTYPKLESYAAKGCADFIYLLVSQAKIFRSEAQGWGVTVYYFCKSIILAGSFYPIAGVIKSNFLLRPDLGSAVGISRGRG